MLSSSPKFISPRHGTQTSTHAPPRVRYHPPLATAKPASCRTSNTSSNHLRPRGMTPCASLYEILGIPAGATGEEIKSAYRRLVRSCHPDVVTVERKNSSADEFMRIHAAYSTLSDPAKRAVYDRKLFRRSTPLTMASGYSRYSGRNWETDQCW